MHEVTQLHQFLFNSKYLFSCRFLPSATVVHFIDSLDRRRLSDTADVRFLCPLSFPNSQKLCRDLVKYLPSLPSYSTEYIDCSSWHSTLLTSVFALTSSWLLPFYPPVLLFLSQLVALILELFIHINFLMRSATESPNVVRVLVKCQLFTQSMHGDASSGTDFCHSQIPHPLVYPLSQQPCHFTSSCRLCCLHIG